jgi:hypothetical protein
MRAYRREGDIARIQPKSVLPAPPPGFSIYEQRLPPPPKIDYARVTEDDIIRNQYIRLNTIYKIVDKDGRLVDFRMNAEQYDFYRGMHNKNIILKARQRGFCLDTNTRILTADLRWIRIADAQPGDELVGVDEYPKGGKGTTRHMRKAVVQAAVRVHRDAYRITFDDGRSVVCTSQHPWLARTAAAQSAIGWRTIANDSKGTRPRCLMIGDQVRWVTKPWSAPDYEDGWFAGMLDGEGSMAKSSRVGSSVNVSQRPGPVLERAKSYLTSRGYSWRVEAENKSAHKLVVSRTDEVIRLIGQTQPTRMRRDFWVDRWLPGRRVQDVGWATIVDIQRLPDQDMIDLQTSTGTYIAEGFVSHNTTLIQLFLLDMALFTANTSCGVIAHTKDDATKFFDKKIKLAYDNIPADFKQRFVPSAEQDSKNQLKFSNGSYITVGTSLRSDTMQYLHISEFGKLCAKYPEKADEVVSGALNTVSTSNWITIESTGEGSHGHFYDMCKVAKRNHDLQNDLSPMDYKFFFYPWWQAREYAMDFHIEPDRDDIRYLKEIYAQSGIRLTRRQRNWYIAKSREQGEKMLREFPSTSEEAFRGILQGAPFSRIMARLRRKGQIGRVKWSKAHEVNTFWDLGRNDMMAIWFHQRIGFEDRFIDYFEDNFQSLDYYAQVLARKPYKYGEHYLPHDVEVTDLSRTDAMSRREVLESLGVKPIITVPRISSEEEGVNMTRSVMDNCYFDEDACEQGIKCLENVKYRWDEHLQAHQPALQRTWAKHGADAFMQFGHGYRHRRVQRVEKKGDIELSRDNRVARGSRAKERLRGSQSADWRT